MTPGGNGEFPHLLLEERFRVLEAAREVTPSNIPLIACVSACSLREVLVYTKHATDVGADGVIATPPYYYKLPEESIYAFFREVAERSELPVIVYNNPAYTGHNIPPRLMVKLAEAEGIIGMK